MGLIGTGEVTKLDARDWPTEVTGCGTVWRVLAVDGTGRAAIEAPDGLGACYYLTGGEIWSLVEGEVFADLIAADGGAGRDGWGCAVRTIWKPAVRSDGGRA